MDMTYYPGTYTTADDARIRDGYRVRVVGDEDAESPLEWGDHITTDSDEYKRWAAGDVYGVIVERPVTWTNDETKEKMTTYEIVDSLWSCYLDPDYTGITVANEIAPYAVEG